ncbi:hypothetical protein OF83DRAFT_1167679 [Amylostereum chailletii]|nr:hypothetical protein OF83DRAFT_1167679 [Amylostereum chailletii]
MADSDSDFDEFPDPFVGVDWNTVPGLSDAVLTVSANPDRSRNALASTDSLGSILGEDALEGAATPSSHYSFDDLDDSAFAELDALEGGLTVESGSGSGSPSMAGSSRFRAVEGTHVGKAQSDVERISTTNNSIKSSPVQRVSRYFSAQAGEHDSESPVRPRATTGAAITPGKLSTPRKRQKMYLDSPKTTPIKSTKGKEKESPNTGLRRVLSGFEDEMTCPICCDLL